MNPIVISYFATLNRETEAFNALFENGLEILHLRKPDFTDDDVKKMLDSIQIEHHSKIVIHKRKSIIEDFPLLKGIHFSFSDIKTTLKPEYQKSCSVHSLKEYQTLTDDVAYAFISPIFDSISKPDYLGKNVEFRAIKNIKKTTIPIALGGISDVNCIDAIKMGFSTVALLGYIWDDYIKTGDCTSLAKRYVKMLNLISIHENYL